MQSPLSTNKASKKLLIDLGLKGRVSYGFGKNVVQQFFDVVGHTNNANYWEPKRNYSDLIKEALTINYVKHRTKSKYKKYWGISIEEQIIEKKERAKAYLLIYHKKIERGYKNKSMPNKMFQEIMIDVFGHWSPIHKGIKDSNHPYEKKSIDERLVSYM